MFRRRRRGTSGDSDGPGPEQAFGAREEPWPGDESDPAAEDYAEDYDDSGDLYDDGDAALGAADGEQDDAAAPGRADSGWGGDGAHRAVTEPAASRPGRADLGDPATWTRLRDSEPAEAVEAAAVGPWDSASGFPDKARVDFGSLLVPVRDGYDIQVMMSEEEGVSIAVVRGESAIQLQPFAAPRNSGLWHEVLPEIAAEVAKAGGQSAERDGPFGPELVARVTPQGAGARVPPQPLRFIGVDGPRWFLRGLISGPAAVDDELTGQFRDILADVVVVRGEHAQPPRQPLQIQLPEEARQVLEEQQAEQQPNPLDPFRRGPEITETR